MAAEPVVIPPAPETFPAADPNLWWSEAWPKEPEAADPLGGRRAGRNERPPPLDNGIDPSLYRLWGLQPLQNQLVRRGETIIEIWARPSRDVRQAVIRLTLRGDGKAFVQGRAGLGCCEPRIGRKVTFDEALAPGYADAIRNLISNRMWAEPRSAEVEDAEGSSPALCVDGVSWDLTLMVPGEVRHLRRACLDEETGSVADALTVGVGAALGQDPRFDVVFPKGANFGEAKKRYEDLVARGGRLKPAATNKAQPPTVPVVEVVEEPPAPVAVEPAPGPDMPPPQ